ncbi:MAG: hypothetical protein ACO3JL_14325, partial [Myxococcota bacterium]
MRWRRVLSLGVAGVLAVLLWPEPSRPREGAGAAPFRWGHDELFRELEQRFVRESTAGCSLAKAASLEQENVALRAVVEEIVASSPAPADSRLVAIEQQLFQLSARHGACPEHAPAFAELVMSVRRAYKALSRSWDLQDAVAAERLYRLLYGARAALEELVLAMPAAEVPALLRSSDVPSATPSTIVEGVRVHSGDL